jgi:hypothetical protein
MSHQDIVRALEQEWLGCLWTLRGEDYDDLDWHDEQTPKPTEEEINAVIAQLPPDPAAAAKAAASAWAASVIGAPANKPDRRT